MKWIYWSYNPLTNLLPTSWDIQAAAICWGYEAHQVCNKFNSFIPPGKLVQGTEKMAEPESGMPRFLFEVGVKAKNA